MAADTPVSSPPTTPGSSRIIGAAALIAVLTVAARLVGFGRTVVLAKTVGPHGLSDVYLAANTIPNIIFEIVAGGALAGLVVPMLAGSLTRGDRAAVQRTVSALLTWTLTALVPLALVLVVAAGPIIDLLLRSDATAAERQAGVTMLRIFAPQVPLYGIGIVLAGVLQSHRRFAWPVLAPLLSSVTVIATYLLFAASAGSRPPLESVSGGELLILAVGTTLGVVVLSLCLLAPVSRLGLRLRPTYAIEPGQRREVGGLALAGAFTVAAQQLALLIAITLALAGAEGTNSIYNLAQTLFLLPWAVLAVPMATAAYPNIAAAHAVGDRATLDALVSRTGRAVLLLSALGAAGLAALAGPGTALILHTESAQTRSTAALTVLAFAPGLVGYGLTALHQRTLYAVGAQRGAALGIGLGWAVMIVSSPVLVRVLPGQERAAALGLANSIGMTVMGVALALAVRRRIGAPALRGLGRAACAGVVSALAAAGAVWLINGVTSDPIAMTAAQQTPDVPSLMGQGMLAGGVALAVFAAVCALIDRRTAALAASRVTPVLARLRAARGRHGGKGDR